MMFPSLALALVPPLCLPQQDPADLAAAAQARALALPQVELTDLPAWRAHIRPQGEELRHEQIPWLTEFAEGLQAASDEQKPLLFWAMNGHPLGTT